MSKIQAGDIIFVRPNGWLFNLVRRFTAGSYGHIGLIAGYCRDHVLIVESDMNGVDLNDLKWRSVRKEEYAVYRIDGITDEVRTELVDFCLANVGCPYDFSAWTNFIIGSTVFGKDKNMYCSELIYRALRKCKIIKDVYNPEKVSPADIFRLLDAKMELIARVKF